MKDIRDIRSPEQTSPAEYSQQFPRLTTMLGADPGFYILSLHAFIEMVMNHDLGKRMRDEEMRVLSFADKLYLYRQNLIRSRGFTEGDILPRKLRTAVRTFGQVARTHGLTNDVRHNFGRAGAEEARSATWDFLEFCRIAALEHPVLRELSENLDIWDSKATRLDEFDELRKLRFTLHLRDLEIKELTVGERKQRDLETELRRITLELEEASRQLVAQKSEGVELRREIDDLIRRKHHAEGEMFRLTHQRPEAALRESAELRLSSYTRTRREYELSLTRLGADQQKVVDAIWDSPGHVRVRGPAGSGKTVVLLEALRRGLSQQDLFEPDNTRYALITYANTLVKFDRYISDILNISDDRVDIRTADSMLSEILSENIASAQIRYENLLPGLLEAMGDDELPDFLDDAELIHEIDGFIWGNGLTYRDYVEDMIPRRGLKGRLDAGRRELVWSVQEYLAGEMDAQLMFTRNYAVKKLAACELEPVFERLYIDEVQDLPPAMVGLFAKICRKCTVAGDDAQAIYRQGSDLSRSGLDFQGGNYRLGINYRNSIPIHAWANEFLRIFGGSESSSTGSSVKAAFEPEASAQDSLGYREGPPVRLYSSLKTLVLKEQLLERLRYFTSVLEYDPENICVICPDNQVLSELSDFLSPLFSCISIKNPAFEFGESDDPTRDGAQRSAGSGKLRLSPIHSAKGLDFPVVMLYLPRLYLGGQVEESVRLKMAGRLVYVALTRAMDHLEIFLRRDESGESPELSAVTRAFHELGSGEGANS